MKVGIITFHSVINYGGVLQAYALQKAIQRLTVKEDVKIINYINPYFEQQYSPLSLSMLRHPKSLLSKLGLAKYKRQRNKKFSSFVRQYLDLSGERIGRKQLKNECAKYEKLVTGSDQVWNPHCTGEDFTYFLDIDCQAKKYSYAASFGIENLDSRYEERVKACLEKFEKISVRENSGAEIVRNLLNKQVEVLPDPTLLLEASDWEEIEMKPEGIPGRYILIVQMGGEVNDLCSYAKKIDCDLPIVFINLAQKPVTGIINYCAPSPEEWLYLIHHANYVVTNSFHGCVFSILFNRNFYYELTKGKTSNTRLCTLANAFGIENRNVTTLTENSIQKDINYDIIEDELAKMRQRGYRYLRDIIGETI